MTQILAHEVTAALDAFAPPHLAMPKDVIGLQVGRLDKPVRKIWLALDASPAVIAAAVEDGADMLLTHHAMLYRPAERIDTTTPKGKSIADALRADLTVYNAHTNLDIAEGGVNDVLADMLGLSDIEVLDGMHTDELYKLVVYVPTDYREAVFRAVCTAGAGHIGAYSHCTFQVTGLGTFLPSEGTHPFIGQRGELEQVQETRLETVVPSSRLKAVMAAMLEAHPYEEVAYDVYALHRDGHQYGLGRVGNLASAIPLQKFADFARDALGLRHIRFGGDPNLAVNRVAVLGGAGGRWAGHAIRAGAQVLLTSDCDHHTVAEAWDAGLAIVDATHAAMERPVLQRVKQALHRVFGDVLDIRIANVAEDPFTWI